MSKFKFLMVTACFLAVIVVLSSSFKEEETQSPQTPSLTISKVTQTDPPCLQMYFYIEQYADSFNIPKNIAYGIAKSETGYRGAFHWKYNHRQTSSANAVGPMQVKVSTARWINKDNVSTEKLRNDIEYNVFTSMKLLRKLYNKNNNWKTALGEYNTGNPCINGYAIKIYNHKINWI